MRKWPRSYSYSYDEEDPLVVGALPSAKNFAQRLEARANKGGLASLRGEDASNGTVISVSILGDAVKVQVDRAPVVPEDTAVYLPKIYCGIMTANAEIPAKFVPTVDCSKRLKLPAGQQGRPPVGYRYPVPYDVLEWVPPVAEEVYRAGTSFGHFGLTGRIRAYRQLAAGVTTNSEKERLRGFNSKLRPMGRVLPTGYEAPTPMLAAGKATAAFTDEHKGTWVDVGDAHKFFDYPLYPTGLPQSYTLYIKKVPLIGFTRGEGFEKWAKNNTLYGPLVKEYGGVPDFCMQVDHTSLIWKALGFVASCTVSSYVVDIVRDNPDSVFYRELPLYVFSYEGNERIVREWIEYPDLVSSTNAEPNAVERYNAWKFSISGLDTPAYEPRNVDDLMSALNKRGLSTGDLHAIYFFSQHDYPDVEKVLAPLADMPAGAIPGYMQDAVQGFEAALSVVRKYRGDLRDDSTSSWHLWSSKTGLQSYIHTLDPNRVDSADFSKGWLTASTVTLTNEASWDPYVRVPHPNDPNVYLGIVAGSYAYRASGYQSSKEFSFDKTVYEVFMNHDREVVVLCRGSHSDTNTVTPYPGMSYGGLVTVSGSGSYTSVLLNTNTSQFFGEFSGAPKTYSAGPHGALNHSSNINYQRTSIPYTYLSAFSETCLYATCEPFDGPHPDDPTGGTTNTSFYLYTKEATVRLHASGNSHGLSVSGMRAEEAPIFIGVV